ncbi:MAG: hypothetical protein IKP36_09295 [Bacteroidaceae bacterium]|nr:hypothetical protein [Bacteroidaceae bacterium]
MEVKVEVNSLRSWKLKWTTPNMPAASHSIVLPVLLPVLLFLYSCGGSKDERHLLDSIEQTWQLCETSLPEACSRAEGLRDSVLASSEYVRQKYNLLTIRLRDKSYIAPSSPDSALQAVSYFTSRKFGLRFEKDAVDKERAYYYAGSAYRDLKDYPRAVRHFLKAVDAAKQSSGADTLIWQNALSQLRYLYMLQLNYEEELNVALQAVELAKAAPSKGGVKRNLGAYLTDVASAYEHLNDTLHCLMYCDLSYQVIQQEHFPAKYATCLAYILTIYSKFTISQFDNLTISQSGGKIDAMLQHLAQLPENQRPRNYELSLAMYHENASCVDSAIVHYKTYYDREKSLSGRYEASAGLQRCYLRKGDNGQAAQWGCRLYDTNDSIIAQRAFEETQRARDTYTYYRDKEKERAIVQRGERIIFACIIALLSIVWGLTAFYSHRRKKLMEEIIGKDKMLKSANEEILHRREELEQKQQEMEHLGRQLDDAEQTIAASKAQLENTMKDLEQRAMINRELTRIALMNSATDKTENVIAHFREVASGHSSLRDNSWKELMTAIEALHPGFLEKVQGRMKRPLREPLLRTICLMKIGMTLVQIAQVMDVSRQTAWNRMKRAEEICGEEIHLVLSSLTSTSGAS